MEGICGVKYADNFAYADFYRQKQEPKFTGKQKVILNYQQKLDRSNNGDFDLSEAGKNFVKGVVSPITAVIKHPIATLGLIGGTLVACSAVPVLGPALAVGFGAMSLLQLAKGVGNAASNAVAGDYDAAEKSFNDIGEGTIGTLLSALGIKQSARVAKEAKLMSELGTTTLDKAQKSEIIAQVNENGFYKNLKDVIKLFTTKQGIQTSLNQFKSNMIKARIKDIKGFFEKFKSIKKEEKVKISTQEQIDKFKKSPEGIRRAALTDKQIEAEVKDLFKKSFDEYGIPESQRPKLVISKGSETKGGSYNKGYHKIEFNPESYKSGIFEMEDVIMHETTHCREALLRSGIPQEQVDGIVQDELIGRVLNGEPERVIKGASFIGADMMKPPKMSQGMKNDFIKFAKDNLYTKDAKLNEILKNYDLYSYAKKQYPAEWANAEIEAAPILEKLKALVKKHPEFVEQYGSEKAAVDVLFEYSKAHNFRYNYFTDTKIKIGHHLTKDFKWENDYVDVGELTPEQLKHARQSLIDNIATIEGNGRASGIKFFGMSKDEFNQYQFSPEEVLAQKKGNQFLIDHVQAKMDAMRKAGTLTDKDAAYMTKVINKAKATIEYKLKGQEYYQKYTQLLNNPKDEALIKEVEQLAKELETLEVNIDPDAYKTVTKIVRGNLTANYLDIPTVVLPTNAIYQIINEVKKAYDVVI